METDVKLTKLASCAGCGAKVGAGTLVKMLDGFRTHTDPRLIVGYDKSVPVRADCRDERAQRRLRHGRRAEAGAQHHVPGGLDGR